MASLCTCNDSHFSSALAFLEWDSSLVLHLLHILAVLHEDGRNLHAVAIASARPPRMSCSVPSVPKAHLPPAVFAGKRVRWTVEEHQWVDEAYLDLRFVHLSANFFCDSHFYATRSFSSSCSTSEEP